MPPFFMPGTRYLTKSSNLLQTQLSLLRGARVSRPGGGEGLKLIGYAAAHVISTWPPLAT
jgi:hypothetical protein